MCIFVTAGIPAAVSPDDLDSLLREPRLLFQPLPGSSVAALLPEGYRYGRLGAGHCDCDTCLGALQRSGGRGGSPVTRSHLRRLRRKGWSEQRAAQWLEERARAAEHKAEAALRGQQECAEGWLRLLRRLLALSGDAPVWLLLHFYSGDLERENLPLPEQAELPIESLTPEGLLTLREDTLYRVTPPAGLAEGRHSLAPDRGAGPNPPPGPVV